MRTALLFLLVLISACKVMELPLPRQTGSMTGSAFYKTAAAFNWKQRDSLAVQQILAGNIPDFLRKFIPVDIQSLDSFSGSTIRATIYVLPDYLAVGNNNDWARVPLTPMGAQKIADSVDCFLPTRKIVNELYKAATVRLEPLPMFAYRDSTPTMYHHHLMIEGQRQGRKGLIAGIKKDVVISGKVPRDARPNRVAIFGWHLPDGKPIQPLYTGHVNWYADYSHGIRLIHKMLKVEGRWMDHLAVMQHPVYKALICDEEYCDFYRYPY